jgi:hypothetical protein
MQLRKLWADILPAELSSKQCLSSAEIGMTNAELAPANGRMLLA